MLVSRQHVVLRRSLTHNADDDKYSAHSGLIGKEMKHVDVAAMAQKKISRDNAAVAKSLIGQNGQDWCALFRTDFDEIQY
jgi:hypothetical protein